MSIPKTRPTRSPTVGSAPVAAADTVPAPTVSDTGPRPATQPALGLAAVVATGLQALSNLRAPGREVTSGGLERALRFAVERHEQSTVPSAGPTHDPAAGPERLAGVAVAVRVACAHLGAGNLVDARLALFSALDALPHRDRHDDVDDVEDQASALSQSQQRALGAGAALAQAAGVLAEHTGANPTQALAFLRAYADRHRFVVSELAGDIVAGRVLPSAVAGPGTVPDRRARTSPRTHIT